MTRASKRERMLHTPRPRGKVGSFFLVAFLLVLVLALVWGLLRIAPLIGAMAKVNSSVFKTPVPMNTPGETPRPTVNPLVKPFNVLLLGVDRRPEPGDGARSDVNIVVHVDPVHRFASMLSIPRDTYVYIPDFGYYKINAAYSLGQKNMPDAGGGPGLATRTMQNFLGITIDYYAEIDFGGFEKIVDMVGGITVDVPAPLVDNEYPTSDYGFTRIYFPAGLQHMDGVKALQYARSRHADSDIGRNQRQQQVLLALRNRILRLDTLTDLDRMTALLNQLAGSLSTDMPRGYLWDLFQLASEIPQDHITSYALDWQCLSEISGTYELVPDVGCVQRLVQEMQTDPTKRKLDEEGAWIEVRNGTLTCNLCAAHTANDLRDQGFKVGEALQDQNAGIYTRTLVLDGGDHPFTRELLGELLRVQPGFVRQQPITSTNADIVIILGDDFEELPPR